MASAKYLEIVAFLSNNLSRLYHDGGGGSALDFPEFDLMAFDYLEFAEQELLRAGPAARINCVGHLKRAVECELDTLLAILGVGQKVKNFPKKMEFAGSVGIISPRSLTKLNQLRNRMEHDYAAPELSELEIYFDLASGFVHAVEGFIFMLAYNQEMEWVVERGSHSIFSGKVETSPPRVAFQIDDVDGSREVAFEAAEFLEYCEGLKIFFLLCRAVSLVGHEYVLSKLGAAPIQDESPRPSKRP